MERKPETTNTDARQVLTPAMVGFRLLKLTNLMSRPFFGEFAKHHKLTLNEWRSIVVLANQPGSAAQDIAAATGLHAMNISRALSGLRKAGLVREARDPENHRRVLLWLTKSGQDMFRQIAPHSEQNARLMLDVLTPDEMKMLGVIIDKLIGRAEIITGAGGDDE